MFVHSKVFLFLIFQKNETANFDKYVWVNGVNADEGPYSNWGTEDEPAYVENLIKLEF